MASTTRTAVPVILRTCAVIAVGSHIGVTLASLGYASGRFGGANSELLLRDEASSQAAHFVFISEMVTSMYAGNGIHHEHVQLADEVVFADPAAICRGKFEVMEAFRALRYLHPEPLHAPRCVDVEPKGASFLVKYSLYQRYMGGWLQLPSLLVVEAQLKQRHDMPQSDFVILGMEEQWNAVPLLTTYLNKTARRFNGMLSYQATKRLLQSSIE